MESKTAKTYADVVQKEGRDARNLLSWRLPNPVPPSPSSTRRKKVVPRNPDNPNDLKLHMDELTSEGNAEDPLIQSKAKKHRRRHRRRGDRKSNREKELSREFVSSLGDFNKSVESLYHRCEIDLNIDECEEVLKVMSVAMSYFTELSNAATAQRDYELLGPGSEKREGFSGFPVPRGAAWEVRTESPPRSRVQTMRGKQSSTRQRAERRDFTQDDNSWTSVVRKGRKPRPDRHPILSHSKSAEPRPSPVLKEKEIVEPMVQKQEEKEVVEEEEVVVPESTEKRVQIEIDSPDREMSPPSVKRVTETPKWFSRPKLLSTEEKAKLSSTDKRKAIQGLSVLMPVDDEQESDLVLEQSTDESSDSSIDGSVPMSWADQIELDELKEAARAARKELKLEGHRLQQLHYKLSSPDRKRPNRDELLMKYKEKQKNARLRRVQYEEEKIESLRRAEERVKQVLSKQEKQRVEHNQTIDQKIKSAQDRRDRFLHKIQESAALESAKADGIRETLEQTEEIKRASLLEKQVKEDARTQAHKQATEEEMRQKKEATLSSQELAAKRRDEAEAERIQKLKEKEAIWLAKTMAPRQRLGSWGSAEDPEEGENRQSPRRLSTNSLPVPVLRFCRACMLQLRSNAEVESHLKSRRHLESIKDKGENYIVDMPKSPLSLGRSLAAENRLNEGGGHSSGNEEKSQEELQADEEKKKTDKVHKKRAQKISKLLRTLTIDYSVPSRSGQSNSKIARIITDLQGFSVSLTAASPNVASAAWFQGAGKGIRSLNVLAESMKKNTSGILEFVQLEGSRIVIDILVATLKISVKAALSAGGNSDFDVVSASTRAQEIERTRYDVIQQSCEILIWCLKDLEQNSALGWVDLYNGNKIVALISAVEFYFVQAHLPCKVKLSKSRKPIDSDHELSSAVLHSSSSGMNDRHVLFSLLALILSRPSSADPGITTEIIDKHRHLAISYALHSHIGEMIQMSLECWASLANSACVSASTAVSSLELLSILTSPPDSSFSFLETHNRSHAKSGDECYYCDALQLVRETEFFGIVESITCALLRKPLRKAHGSDDDALWLCRIAVAGLSVITNVAGLDQSLFQEQLSVDESRRALQHILKDLLPHAIAMLKEGNLAEDSKEVAVRLLNETVLLLGHFTVTHGEAQKIMNFGDSPTLMQLLCDLPFEYYAEKLKMEILLPTIICSCYNNSISTAILQQELGLELLSEFLESKISNDNSDESMAIPSRFSFAARFPQQQWQSALDFFNKAIEEEES